MMKFKFGLVFLLMPLFFVAQTKNNNKAISNEFDQFYSNYNLKPDSAVSLYLFYQVYDWVGTRYKYSGTTKRGIDCSGFVSEMYRNTYCINLSGGSKDIWPNVKPIEKKELIEGDLLFFKIRKGQISHVGLYLGNDKFAHASVHSGVIISDLNEEYYKKYFFKGGRAPIDGISVK